MSAGNCGEDEMYLSCGSACAPTCSTLGRTDFACIALCVPGCFCTDGLVRNDQGECVEPEECPQDVTPIPAVPKDSCREDEVYLTCGSACPPTCSTLRRTDVACISLCVQGCFCRDGLVRNDQGECVEPEECPQKKCPKNEEYSDCVIPCNDCKTRGNCNFLVCNKGCDCREGYYRDFNGRCILSRQCPQILPTPPVSTCKADEQYYECIPSCDRTCKAYRRKEKIFCNQICISGCFCKDGLYLADDGKTCVPPEQCDKTPSSPTKKCPKNEEYSDCVVPCNDCQTRGKCNFLVCNKGCDCRKGYYRDFNGRCIPARQCPLIDPTPAPADCSPDQQYYECIPRCSRTCKAYTKSVEIFCNQLCVEGCFCKEGLYEAEDGSCVPPEQCSAPTTSSGEQCPENEEYSDCVNPCNDCQTRGNCNFLVCNKGCDCKKGYYRDFDGGDGRCILGLQCPMIGSTPPPNQCGVDEQFYDCIPGCQQTCFALTSEVKIACKMPCRSGCYCREGLYKKDDDTCVQPEECYDDDDTRVTEALPGVTPTKTPNCGKNEEYYRCIPTCKNTCENYQAVKPLCPRICIAGCSCKKGFVKRSDGKCVKPEKCNKSAPTIKPTSSSPIQCSIPLCRVGCNIDYSTKPCPSCSCSSSTPSPPKCDKDEEYYDCVPNCHNTCDTYNKKGPCPLFCISGCFCKKGMIKNKDGKCVKPSKCPSSNPPSSAPAPASNPDCQQPKEVGPCRAIMPRFFFNQESRQCEQFNYGGCRGNKNNFKTKEDCESKCGSASPTPPPTPTCGADGQYYQCIPVCRNTCATYNKTNIACPDICESGCFCKEGMVKNEDGTCVSPSQCNVLKPTDGSEECGEDEEYYDDCAPKCTGTCEAYNNPGIYNCPLCKPGCWCSQGLVKRSDGQCVSPDQCDAPNSTEPPDQCGENEEYYEDCAPSCGGTCETYKKLPILNCRLCRPGCWCSKGLVKRKDGKCVPKDQCGAPTDVTPSPADSCGEDEEYQDCGSACPPTCATLGRTDFACLAVCVPGCFCKEGLVRNDQGDCVEPEDCPQKTCSKDEEYKECGSSCPPTCSTLGKRQICTRECVPGCFCREGLVRNDQGECVEPEDCPPDENPQKCGEDEEYTDCGSACPPTCSNIGKDQVCTDQCVPGCFCAEGLVRNEKGECVEPEECPQRNSEECGEDEKYYDCAPSCGGTCDTYNKTAVILCLPCGPGCWCNEGLVKNNEGKCIPPEQCDVPKGPHKLCGLNEIYYDECAPSCRGTCETHDQNVECPECVPGCWCKKGYLKNQFGKCVLERKCNMKQKIPQCPKDQQYYDCIPSCKRTCMTYNSTSAYCPKECIMGCFCKEGLVMNKNGECVPPEKCPITCPFNQKYYECMPDCQNRCNPPDACAAVCKSGCFCREGLVMREDGKCVRKNLCKGKNPGKPRCKPDQEYYECFQRCRNSCATRNGVCPAVCESGCFCKKGLLLDSEGNCVEPEECDDISNSAEDGSDENPDSDENSEPDNEPGDEGKCSGVNEEIVSCAKPKTCNTCLIRGNCKLKRCEKGCDCKSGYYRDDSGVCIPQDQCPGATSPSECTGENEEMVSCAKPKWCNTCGIRGNCKLKQCEAGCDCKQGYYRDDSGVCIPEDQCPGDTSSPSTLRCSMPKCDDDCNIDYSTKPCPSCSCPDSSAVQCSMPKCDDDCSIDYSTKPCPSCSCPDLPTIQCSIPKCDEDGCSIDYSTKPCPSCSCAGSPTIQCSIPKCDNDGCSIDYSTKPCPSCSCTSSPTIQCSMPKCDDEGCSIDYSTKPCPSCSCIGSPTIQCSIPKCDDDGCSVDYSTKPCPSCSCTGSPMIQCSIPKCDEDGCSIDYSTKPCPRCSCTGDSNANPANTSGADNENDSPDGSSYSEESFSSTSETESSESGSMSQSADARNKYSRSRSGSRNRSSGNSSGNEIDSKNASESRFSESGSMSQSADARKKYYRSRSGSRSRSSGSSSDNEVNSEKNSSDESEEGTSSMSSDAIDWSSDTSSDSENSSLRFSSEMWSSSISDGNSEENEVDSTDESAVDEDMSSSDSESGYSTMSSDSENEDQNNYLDESSVSEDTTSSDRGSGYSRSSSGSTDWSSANSEKSPSKFQSGSRTRYSKMSSDFDNDEEEQEYEEYYKEDLYEEDEATYKGNGNESEEYSFSWTEYN
ncbi:unnamed protein product [Larinioides sclopetarius]|uniref:BPTI/Kunitz inhibitor domain-containing protein n=1 Tax=Larinioides sclopetarius TaxID=280406 RepID=A0AAV1Z6V9_9ARAC